MEKPLVTGIGRPASLKKVLTSPASQPKVGMHSMDPMPSGLFPKEPPAPAAPAGVLPPGPASGGVTCPPPMRGLPAAGQPRVALLAREAILSPANVKLLPEPEPAEPPMLATNAFAMLMPAGEAKASMENTCCPSAAAPPGAAAVATMKEGPELPGPSPAPADAAVSYPGLSVLGLRSTWAPSAAVEAPAP